MRVEYWLANRPWMIAPEIKIVANASKVTSLSRQCCWLMDGSTCRRPIIVINSERL